MDEYFLAPGTEADWYGWREHELSDAEVNEFLRCATAVGWTVGE